LNLFHNQSPERASSFRMGQRPIKNYFLQIPLAFQNIFMKKYLLNTLLPLAFLSQLMAQLPSYKFDFGTDKPEKGYIGIDEMSIYTPQKGYGFIPSEAMIESVERNKKQPSLTSNFITADQRFYFIVDAPEGNYNVKITFGDAKGTSLTTVKVENRRLMLEKVKTTEGVFLTQNFVVNVRDSVIRNVIPNVADVRNNIANHVKLKPRERDYWHWDKYLTFEFCDSLPKIAALEITPIANVTTIYLAGNSTVVDQNLEPYAAWGQMIPHFFTANTEGGIPPVVIANHAESGETLKSFIGEKRLEKVLSLIKSGDYLFIEFAHNDQKIKDLDPFVGYKDLLKQFIKAARSKSAKPVLVTSMHRRVFDASGKIENTLGNFPEAMRQTAKEENVPLLDLNNMSKTLWEALGTEGSKNAFVHVPLGTFPNQDKAIKDDTHFSNYGAYLLAQCLVELLRQNIPELAAQIKKDVPRFDPSVPMPFSAFNFPKSGYLPAAKPDGN
jgi:lysophospholipase L1-like esterase